MLTLQRLLYCSALVICLILNQGSKVLGALQDDVLDADGTPLPSLDQLSLALDKNGDPAIVWVASEGLRPTLKASPRSSQNNPFAGITTIEFMEGFTYVERPGTTDYTLLVRPGLRGAVEDVIGWVPSEVLVKSQSALEVPISGILRKAMIVNRIADLEERVEVGEGVIAPADAPGPNGSPRIDPIRLFNLFFVYAETNSHLLIGNKPSFNPIDPESRLATILGWIPKDRACQWNTREGMLWDTDGKRDPKLGILGNDEEVVREDQGMIFRTAAQGRQNIGGPAVEPLAVEQANQDGTYGGLEAAKRIRHDQMRFPILEWDSKRDGSRIQLGNGDNRLCRVGFVGDLVDRRGDRLLPAGDVARIQRQLDLIREQVNSVEIVFVVDETKSVEPFFGLIGGIVGEVTDRVRMLNQDRESEKLNVKVAVSYFGDVEGGSRAATPSALRDVIASGEEIQREIESHEPTPGGDDLERLYYGIQQAINTAEFSPGARKLVIVLGDMGNKSEQGDPTLDDLVELFFPDRGSPIELYAIQVARPDPERPATINFRDQMNELVARVRNGIERRYPDAPGVASLCDSITSTEENTNILTNQIVAHFETLRQRASEFERDLGALRLNWNTQIGPELERIIEEDFNLPLRRLRELNASAQVFQIGYVWRENSRGEEQLDEQVLLNGRELNAVIEVLDGLERLREDPGRTEPTDFLVNWVLNFAGERGVQGDLRNQSINEILEKTTGLKFQNPLMDRMVKDLEQGNDVRLSRQILSDLSLASSLLEDIRDGVKYEYEERQVELATGLFLSVASRVGRPEDAPRAFYLGGDRAINYYWIDLDQEWP